MNENRSASLADLVAAAWGQRGRIRNKRYAVQLGPIALPTKDAARELVQKILRGAALETPLPDEYTPVLLAILDWHPSKAEKLRYGCRGFVVRTNPPAVKFHDRGFWIVTERPPPAAVSFSYIRCFTGADPPDTELFNQLTKAARSATIQSQLEFKRRHLVPGMLCPGGCEPQAVLTAETCQVDHVDPKFRDIVRAFIALHGMPPREAIEHRPTYGHHFVNPADAEYFAKFHDEHVRVRELVCAPCNMAGARR